ncbi:MAG: o-succinylbenzoate synthase [Geitlerinemataceae cyanobacterium]
MFYQFEFCPYRRRFKQPLQTSHGIWEIREGIVIRLIDEMGKICLGEIAPIPWFGSETFSQALDFCHNLPSEITLNIISSIPANLPACQFGFESAIKLENQTNIDRLSYSILLPTGESAFSAIQEKLSQNIQQTHTFKYKIGVLPIETELSLFDRIVGILPKTTKLRLDANGGLSLQMANRWLKICDRIPQIEFLEQPLGIDYFPEILALSQQYKTPIALDESVSNLARIQDCYQQGWRSIFVIKPAICGFPSKLKKICKHYNLDTVFSSVFETEVGREAALKLAAEIQIEPRAVGFGVENFY